MVQPSNEQELSQIVECTAVQFTAIERRIDLVLRYKRHFNPSINFTQEQRDFINGFMSRRQMREFCVGYETAITEAVELAAAEAERIRKNTLAAKKLAPRVEDHDRSSPTSSPLHEQANYHQGGDISGMVAMIGREKREAALVVVLQDIRSTLRNLQSSGTQIDLRHDIEKLSGALVLLGSPS